MKEHIEKLAAIGKRLLTQDNYFTQNPMYCVQTREGNWKTVMACLSEQGAMDFVRINGHHFGETRIYVESFVRCPEMIVIREAIMAFGKEKQTEWTYIDPQNESTLPPTDVCVVLLVRISGRLDMIHGGRSKDMDGWLWARQYGTPSWINRKWKLDGEFDDLDVVAWRALPEPPEQKGQASDG